jgi:hypothetical protein
LWIAIPLAHAQAQIGREVAIPRHLENDQEFQISLTAPLDFGKQLFTANWTIQEDALKGLHTGLSNNSEAIRDRPPGKSQWTFIDAVGVATKRNLHLTH